ncbi:glycosyltransferase family 2 protein [Methanotorris igneus]|uniref:Glycosyl transferase family 2 n=1 Tax=Methanotorris igneus (strain DSM 5666 / JCM 11834 / Kol 5) TaxID=880724 RepID=F6BAX5_METIK|nr:glycosyltransferase family 2 protein [Methanotorris igneus]AEF97062.1 glycosyl transferase family 2 [Methanotorris igneus Kol 5]
MDPKVSIIILNWNGWRDTIECLESLYRINYDNYNVIVIDNNSEDESIEKIKQYCNGEIEVNSKFFKYSKENKPIKVFELTEDKARNGKFLDKEKYEQLNPNRRLILIKNKDNYGFAGGNNVGIKFALNVLNPKYVLLLNNDTVVDKDFLIEMVKVAESDERIGVVGPKVYFYSEPNKIQTVGVSVKKNPFNIVNIWNYNMIGYGEIDNGQYDVIKQIDSLVGCCILVKTKAINEFGLLDEKFFLYHEESDWLFRISKKYLMYCTPLSKIWHKYSASSGGEFSPTVVYYTTRNSVIFAKKHNNFFNYLLFLIWFLTYKHARRFINFVFLKRKPYLLKYYYKGILDGIIGKYGKRDLR